MSVFIGNWKMNIRPSEAETYCRSFLAKFQQASAGLALAGGEQLRDTWITPPLCTVPRVRELLGDAGVLIGAQNVHWLTHGAHTGEVSAPMLVELGVQYVIVGHSERRQYYGETDEFVSLRAKAAIEHGLYAVVCIGERLEDFKAEQTQSVVRRQLGGSLQGIAKSDLPRLIIAYEPVWAIGTGLAATPETVVNVHGFIREELRAQFSDAGATIPIIYGGSATPENIGSLTSLANVDGALPGGASLKPEVFLDLIHKGREGERSRSL